MALDLAALPDDVDALRALVAAQATGLAAKDAELAAQRLLLGKMQLQLARLRRVQFGHSSERLRAEIEQLELALEDLEAEAPGAGDDAPVTAEDEAADRAKPPKGEPVHRPLPEHLPRETVEHCGTTPRMAGTRHERMAGPGRPEAGVARP